MILKTLHWKYEEWTIGRYIIPYFSFWIHWVVDISANVCHHLPSAGKPWDQLLHFTQCKQSRWNNRNEPEAILPQQQQWGQGTGRRHTIGPKALLCLFVVNCAHTGEYHANHQNSDKNTLFFYWIHLLLEIWNQYKLFYNSREPSNDLFPCDHRWRECRPVSNICNKGTLRQIFRSFRPCLEKPLLAPLH